MQPCLIYIEIIHITGRKNISVICKNPVSQVKKISLSKEVVFFEKLFSLLIFSDEDNIAKLVGDM